MKPIAVLDFETDPFEHGKMIYPFAAGFYDGSVYTSYWGDDCAARLVTLIRSLSKPHIIYAHNGGRFDFFYLLSALEKALRIVNGRIIQCFIGPHELRDSFAILPFELAKYKKTEIDYAKFTRDKREQHRDEILSYLRDDCMDLHTLCVEFRAEFGDNLTVGGTAMKQLRKFHGFQSGNAQYDARIRKLFYFGGRNQCFRTGIINSPVKVYDVNSMYPHVMEAYLHPVSTGIYHSKHIQPNTCFVSVEGKNFGAFPVRRDDGSLDFTESYGTFHTTIHEFEAALDTGTFKPKKIIDTIAYSRRENFEEFVSHYYNARNIAKQNKDRIHELFYKYILNSAYGKFAQNPENYADWYITHIGEFPPTWHNCESGCEADCKRRWTPAFHCEDYIIWEKPIVEQNYYNVATGASITGAARAVLLRGLARADNPLYCDTDSIICSSMHGVKISDEKLGAWKVEATGSRAAICGKKLYAIFDDSGKCIKKAHKGARLTGEDILRIANGVTVESCNPVPTFRWDGSYTFTKRNIRATI